MISTLEQLGQAWLKITKAQLKLFALEAKLAKLSILPLVLCALLLLLLVISAWCCILVCCGYGIYAATNNIFLSMVLTLLLNIFMIMITLFRIYKYFHQMLFLRTRKHINHYFNKPKNYEKTKS